MIFNRAVVRFSSSPRKLFLIDAFGAVLSALLLGFVLVELEGIFGITKKTLYFLASIPVLFAAYDFYCFRRIKKNIEVFLKVLALANLTYCCISLGLAIYHHSKITFLGWCYITVEILIIMSLAILEVQTANKLSVGK